MFEFIHEKTAQQAKVKGFDWPCEYYLDDDDDRPYRVGQRHKTDSGRLRNSTLLTSPVYNSIACTTTSQADLACWLRQEHDVHVQVAKFRFTPNPNLVARSPDSFAGPITPTDGYYFWVGTGYRPLIRAGETVYPSYEQALEAALLAALKPLPRVAPWNR